MTEKIYMDDNVITTTIDGTSYSYQVGIIPEKNEYVAIALKHPKFRFKGATREEVEKMAKSALTFYNKHGIQIINEKSND